MSEKEKDSEKIAPKKVDESWKEEVGKEKEKVGTGSEEKPFPEADFYSFISGLGMQALMFMGEKEKNLTQAKYIIDTLIMLGQKTKGNLSEEEGGLMEGIIHELQMKYVKAVESI